MKAFFTLYQKLLLLLATACLGQLATAQCSNAPTLSFHSPVLISGTDGQVGAIYNFANVAPGLDAHIEVTGIYGGAILYNIDDSTGIGYYDAFQPYVGAQANDTSYIDWRITFKQSGTDTDTMLSCLAVTGVDVDGDGGTLKEFIEAATPGSFSVDPSTNLAVSFDGVRSKAISPFANVPMIDTSHREAMFQMNFTNITTLDYRNGAISTYGAQQIRQTCIYFKPFFQSYFLLPVTLLSFNAQPVGKNVEVKWSATDEDNVRDYVLQRSEDGKPWANIGTFDVLSTNIKNNYLVNDFSDFTTITYYRLMEILKNGTIKYSAIVNIMPANAAKESFSNNTLCTTSILLRASTLQSEEYNVLVYAISGTVVARQKTVFHQGTSTAVIDLPSSVRPGVYLLSVKGNSGQDVYHSRVVRVN